MSISSQYRRPSVRLISAFRTPVKSVLFLLLLLDGAQALSQQTLPPILSGKEFKHLYGSWEGMLTYTDYSSGKSFTLPAKLTVFQSADPDLLRFDYSYPDEPGANSSDTMKIAADGMSFNGEIIEVIEKLRKGGWAITTSHESVDGNDNAPAEITHIYVITKQQFVLTKRVTFLNSGESLTRSVYQFGRVEKKKG